MHGPVPVVAAQGLEGTTLTDDILFKRVACIPVEITSLKKNRVKKTRQRIFDTLIS